MGKHAPFMRQSLNQRFILIMITITIQKRLFSIKGEGMCEKIFSVKMNKLTQVLIPVALLSSVVFGLPLAEDNIFEGLAINLPSNEFHFKLTDSDRIFGGQEAAVGQFPHQISLRVVYKERTIHICGGSIITNRFVITAGHCYVFESFPDPSSYRILAGGHEPGVENGTLYEVNRWIVHEDYYANLTETNATIRNDIALIETAETIEFNDLVAPIALHRKFFEGEVEAVSSGWGRNNDLVSNLKFVHLTTLNNTECRSSFQNNRQIAPVHDWDTICAFSGEFGHGICQGDSGGPLVADNGLIGLTSWAFGCGVGYPDGFTRVSTYIDWVNDKTESSF